MKKLSVIFALVLAVAFIPNISVNAYSEKDENGNTIQVETLADGKEAKELNKYRKRFLKYLNDECKNARIASGDNSYEYLSLNDIDFTDVNKISSIKKYGIYQEYEYNAKYDDFKESLSDKIEWELIIKKNHTIFRIGIGEFDKTDIKSSYQKIGGNWYVTYCFVNVEKNSIYELTDRIDTIMENMKCLLDYYNIENKDVKLLYTYFGDYGMGGGNCAVVFINDTANYIYAGNFETPAFNDTNRPSNIPKEAYDVLEYCQQDLFSSTFGQGIEVKRFREYNLVMSLCRLYEYYKI